MDVPLDVDVHDVTGWEARWMARAQDAEIDSATDKADLLAWLKARGRPGNKASDPDQGVAQTVVQTLEAEGCTISASAAAVATRAVKQLEAGDELSQCTSAKCIWLLYLGVCPTEEEVEWFDVQLRGSSSAGSSEGGTIDITRAKTWSHTVNKTGALILSRALLKSESFC